MMVVQLKVMQKLHEEYIMMNSNQMLILDALCLQSNKSLISHSFFSQKMWMFFSSLGSLAEG